MIRFSRNDVLGYLFLQVPSHALMGISRDGGTMALSPLGEACLRMDLTAIHEILEKLGYKDDEGAATEVCLSVIILRNRFQCFYLHTLNHIFSILSYEDILSSYPCSCFTCVHSTCLLSLWIIWFVAISLIQRNPNSQRASRCCFKFKKRCSTHFNC